MSAAMEASGSRVGRTLRSVVVTVLALLWLVPTWLVVANAITPVERYTGSPRWWPGGWALWANLRAAWDAADFAQTALSSLLYSVVCAGLAVVVATLAAFGLVVAPIRHRVFWFWVIYSGSLLPLQVFARPMFLAAANSNLYDTRVGLGLVYLAVCVPFAFFVVRNYLTTIPIEYTEAARLDGAGWWRVLRSVHLPLARSAMAAAFIFQFVWVWNELFFGQVLTLTPSVQPVMVALAGLQGQSAAISPPVLLAAALGVSIPTVVLFFAFQRLFVRSLKTTV